MFNDKIIGGTGRGLWSLSHSLKMRKAEPMLVHGKRQSKEEISISENQSNNFIYKKENSKMLNPELVKFAPALREAVEMFKKEHPSKFELEYYDFVNEIESYCALKFITWIENGGSFESPEDRLHKSALAKLTDEEKKALGL